MVSIRGRSYPRERCRACSESRRPENEMLAARNNRARRIPFAPSAGRQSVPKKKRAAKSGEEGARGIVNRGRAQASGPESDRSAASLRTGGASGQRGRFSRSSAGAAAGATKPKRASQSDESARPLLSRAWDVGPRHETTGGIGQRDFVDGCNEEADCLQSGAGLRADGGSRKIAQLHE